MHIRKAMLEDLEAVHGIVHQTISNVYPNYYPLEAVDYFLTLHNADYIRQDILKGSVFVLSANHCITGTGTIEGKYIGRIYVLEKHHGKGYGSIIMNVLESEIRKEYKSAYLTASLPSYDFYLRRGYQPIEYHKLKVENNRILCYYKMEKKLDQQVNKPVVFRDNY